MSAEGCVWKGNVLFFFTGHFCGERIKGTDGLVIFDLSCKCKQALKMTPGFDSSSLRECSATNVPSLP